MQPALGVALDSSVVTNLDNTIKQALRSFHQDLCAPGWCGREREMISLYVFGHLAERCDPKGLRLAQIGIEVAVPQLPRNAQHLKRRGDVCKDILIWATPRMTCWTKEGLHREPLAVMEWKVVHQFDRRAQKKKIGEHEADILWLQEKSNRVPFPFVGYAVFVESRKPRTVCARIAVGQVERDWLNSDDFKPNP